MTRGNAEPEQIVTHGEPVWRERANYILMADLDDVGMPGSLEQLWLRDLGEGRFELCCLPLLTYGYSLGDVVETKARGERQVIGPVVGPSGRGLIRLIVHGHGPDHEALHAVIEREGCLSEWRGDGYAVVDIPGEIPPALRAEMDRLAKADRLQWESAGSREVT